MINDDIDKINKISTKAKDRIDLSIKLINSYNSRNVAEIGVWKGDFSEPILRGCSEIEKYYMIDPWATLTDWNKPFNVNSTTFDDIYSTVMDRTKFAKEKIEVLKGRTKEVIDNIPDNSLDYAYIDGDHTLRGITIDLIKLLPKMRENSIIVGDDFTTNPWQHDIKYEPTLVCPYSIYFCEAMELPIFALPFNQFLITVGKQRSFSFTDFTGNYSDISLNKAPSSSKPSLSSIWKNIINTF